MSKLKVLGSVSPYCKENHNCSGYLLYQDDGSKILLDCGFGVSSNMNFPNDLNDLSIIISHLHKDHYSDIFAIAYASYCFYKNGILKNKIKVYIPKTFENSKEYYDYLIIKSNELNYFQIYYYDIDERIIIGDSEISFFPTRHSINNNSIKITNKNFVLTYTGDMGYFNIENYKEYCKNSDLLICEATYLDSDNINDDNHLHAKESAMIAKVSNSQQLLLTHMWPEHDKKEYLNEAKMIFNNTILAEENMIINL